MNAKNIKDFVSSNKAKFGAKPESGGPDFDQTTMFVPVATEGKPVINVTKRQDFMDTSLATWREFHFYRAAAIMGGVLSVILLFSNVFLSAAVAMGAAWSYGEFLKKDFTINVLYKQRYLLES